MAFFIIIFSPSSCKCIINLSSNLHVWSAAFRLQISLKEGEDPVIWSISDTLGVYVGRSPVLARRGGLLPCRRGAGGQRLSCFPSRPSPAPSPHSHHFFRAPTSGEGTCGPVVETFCRGVELILPQTDPASPRSRGVKEMKGVEKKNVSTSNREISIWSAVSSQILPSSSTFFPLSSVYQFLLTTVSWLRDKQAQLHWYYILQLQTDHGD